MCRSPCRALRLDRRPFAFRWRWNSPVLWLTPGLHWRWPWRPYRDPRRWLSKRLVATQPTTLRTLIGTSLALLDDVVSLYHPLAGSVAQGVQIHARLSG